ncbi:hypothetical protein PR048_017231 [Dryococelus australis]|uniref:Uncharacterized protein n=1 Tax=Dryococelus australis TaxID=614101 RepID=A0ABQ9H954_9NEOP|nr:hypothetical protein PR048_017231 [Dryococelus australis]
MHHEVLLPSPLSPPLTHLAGSASIGVRLRLAEDINVDGTTEERRCTHGIWPSKRLLSGSEKMDIDVSRLTPTDRPPRYKRTRVGVKNERRRRVEIRSAITIRFAGPFDAFIARDHRSHVFVFGGLHLTTWFSYCTPDGCRRCSLLTRASPVPCTSNARLHHRISKLGPRSHLRSTQKTVAPFEFRAGLEIVMKFISNRQNWRFEISIRDQQPSSSLRIENCLGLETGKLLVPLAEGGIAWCIICPCCDFGQRQCDRSGINGVRIVRARRGQEFHESLLTNDARPRVRGSKCAQIRTCVTHASGVTAGARARPGLATCLSACSLAPARQRDRSKAAWRSLPGESVRNLFSGCGGVVVRLLAYNHGEPGSIPGGVDPRIFACGTRAGRDGGFLGDLPFPRPCIPALLRTQLRTLLRSNPHRLSRPRCWPSESLQSYGICLTGEIPELVRIPALDKHSSEGNVGIGNLEKVRRQRANNFSCFPTRRRDVPGAALLTTQPPDSLCWKTSQLVPTQLPRAVIGHPRLPSSWNDALAASWPPFWESREYTAAILAGVTDLLSPARVSNTFSDNVRMFW